MRQEHLTKLQVALREMEDRTAEIREVVNNIFCWQKMSIIFSAGNIFCWQEDRDPRGCQQKILLT
jgi:hypothetical protein